MSSCCLRPLNKQPSTNYVRDAQVLLSPYVKEMTDDDKTLEALFTGMKETVANPGLPEICKTDPLIREFAKSLLCRLGPSDDQRIKDLDNIRTKVRTVGRLLSQLNENRTEALPLEKFISGTHFTYVVNATKALALKTNSPQIALVLGHYMKHSALLKISLGIQNAFVEMQNEGRDFQILYQAHWNNQVSCVAKRRQRLRTLNKPAEIPVTDDLVTLKNWLQKELTECLTVQTPDKETWKRIAQMALVRIALFNKRRISEVQDIRVSDFLDADSNDEIDGEIFNSLDMPEKILSKR